MWRSRGAAPPRPRGLLSGRQQRDRSRHRRGLRRARLGHRQHGVGWRDPGGRPGGLRAGRPPRNRRHAGRRRRHPRTVAHGCRLAGRPLRAGRAGAARIAASPRGPLAGRVPGRPVRDVVAGDVVGGPPVRRRVRPVRPAGRDPLRGSGGHRTGAVRRPGRDRRLPAPRCGGAGDAARGRRPDPRRGGGPGPGRTGRGDRRPVPPRPGGGRRERLPRPCGRSGG